MKVGTLRWTLWGIAAAALLLGIWSGSRILGLSGLKGAPVTITGHTLPEPRPVAPFELTDHLGRPFDLDSLKGRWTLVFFGYTFCPDVCPMTLQVVGEAQRQLTDTSASKQLAYVFISVDPERDTLDRLAQYATHFSPDILGVTGSHPQILTMSRPLGVIYAKVDSGDTEDYLVDHSASLFLINPDAELHAVLTAPHTAETIADDLLKLLDSYRG